jgi:hypothetical protein
MSTPFSLSQGGVRDWKIDLGNHKNRQNSAKFNLQNLGTENQKPSDFIKNQSIFLIYGVINSFFGF